MEDLDKLSIIHISGTKGKVNCTPLLCACYSMGQFLNSNLLIKRFFSVRAQLVHSVKVYYGIKASRQGFIGTVKIY